MSVDEKLPKAIPIVSPKKQCLSKLEDTPKSRFGLEQLTPTTTNFTADD